MSCCLNGSITLFFGSSNSQGSQIANYWALSSTPSVALDHQWTRGETKKVLHAQTLSLWQKEWAASVNGQFTRRFFPDIASAYVLKERPTSNITSQVLTGHCVLNGHQHRFGFIFSPLYACSLAPETIEHFLFECTFCLDRRTLEWTAVNIVLFYAPCQIHLSNSLRLILSTLRMLGLSSCLVTRCCPSPQFCQSVPAD